MAETTAKTTTQSRDAEQAQEKKRRPEPAPESSSGLVSEPILLDALLGSSAGDPAAERYAALLGDPRFSHSANAGQKACLMSSLQRSQGNAYVQRLLASRSVQAKLTVNPPDDQYEREADVVAATFARTPNSQILRQAKEEEEKVEMKPDGSGLAAGVQRQAAEEEEEKKIQAKATGSQVPEVSDDLEMRINAARSSGEALTDNIRASFEPQFGRDFSNVRLHTDAEAHDFSHQLGARAFTTGQDIFFRSGDYQPESDEGKKLLGHEMTHVVQQGAASVSRQPAETKEEVTPEEKPTTETKESSLPSWKVTKVRGTVTAAPPEALEKLGASEFWNPPTHINVKVGDMLYAGSRIITEKKARVELVCSDGSVYRLGSRTTLILEAPPSEKASFSTELMMLLYKLLPDYPEMDMRYVNNSIAGVRG